MAAIIFYLKTVTSPAEYTRYKTISLREFLNFSQIFFSTSDSKNVSSLE